MSIYIQYFLYLRIINHVFIFETSIMNGENNSAAEFNYAIPMLKKGFDMLEIMTHYPEGITMLEITQAMGLSKTTVNRLLGSLQQMGYVSKNETNARYHLTKKLLGLGLKALGEANLVELSLPVMQALRDEIKESVMLGILMNNRVVLLEQVIGSHNFTFLLRSGNSFNLHSSVPGKIFLAYTKNKILQEQLLDSIDFQVYNERTIASKDAMLQEIEEVRSLGYALDQEEEMAGVHCVATPIFNQFGMLIAALWTSGPSGRLRKEDFPEVARKLQEASDLISLKLGYAE